MKEPVTVPVANAQQVSFMSATVNIGIETVDGKVTVSLLLGHHKKFVEE